MKTILLILTLVLFGLASCKKNIYGCTDPTALNYSTEANKDDGSCISNQQQVYIEEFWINFGPGVSSDYYVPNFYKESGDIIIMEIESDNVGGTPYWSALPYNLHVTDTYVYGEYTESGLIWIGTEYENGSAANWTSNATLHFRAALIKKYGLKKNPNLEKLSIDELKEFAF